MEDSKPTQARDRFPGESLNITLYGVFFSLEADFSTIALPYA